MRVSCPFSLLFVSTVLAKDSFRFQNTPESVCVGGGNGPVGYFDFDDDNRHLFFWMAESRNDPVNDPVVLWMSGGPGASSVGYGMLSELGPCQIDGPNSTKANPYGWNEQANVLFVDQPVGVGFSYSDKPSESVEEAMNDMYQFLTSFMVEFPQYSNQDFYIVGESFSGTWVPALARKIHQRQSSPMAHVVRSTTCISETRINLKGIALGNAQLSQGLQWPGFFSTGCMGENPVFNESVCTTIAEHLPQCEHMLKVCARSHHDLDVCSNVLSYCRSKSVWFMLEEHRNPYDFRKPCDDMLACDETSVWVQEFLNSSRVKMELGVDEKLTYTSIDLELNQHFTATGQLLYESVYWVEDLLDQGYQVMVYVGNKDWFCNAAGERNLVQNIRWKRQPQFRAKELEAYTQDGQHIGWFKQEGLLSFAEIEGAGHMLPADKPKEALCLINSWLYGKLQST